MGCVSAKSKTKDGKQQNKTIYVSTPKLKANNTPRHCDAEDLSNPGEYSVNKSNPQQADGKVQTE